MESSQAKKPRKKRKPMTPEQREAAAARLAEAREKRQAERLLESKSIHESLKNLPESHPRSPSKVRKWIITQKKIRADWAKKARKNEKGAEAKFLIADTYIKNMEYYLRTGEWVDLFFGEHQEHLIKYRCIKKAYYNSGPMKGMVKRSIGVYYGDVGEVWTKELDDDYHD